MNKFAKEPPEGWTFYLDECLGGEKVAKVLIEAGLKIEMYFNHFQPGTPDVQWLPFVGQNGWVLLTQDKGIKKRKMEILALRESRVSAFVVAAKGLRGEEIGQLIVKSLPKIDRILRKNRPPIVATITRGSVVELQEGTPRNPARRRTGHNDSV